MTMAHRNNGAKIKQRWKDAEVVASRIGITKFQCYNFLMTMIIAQGWLEAAKNGDAEVVAAIKVSEEWKRMINQPAPIRVMNEDEEDEDEEPTYQKRKYQENGMATTPGEKLNCAMWLIRKIGSVEEAKIAVDLAGQAMNKLARRTEHTRS
jgi:hypothetical protein